MAAPLAPARKIRILFFAEAVTLAHVARPYVLAMTLDRDRFDVHFAHHPRYRSAFGDLPFTEHEIQSIEPRQFTAALAQGTPLYDTATLRAYAAADLALIAKVRPDVIVGDFRLSLAVSAEVSAVPYMALSNAYWCPYTVQKYTVPELPIVGLVGPRIGQFLFNLVRPFAFFSHTRPLHRVRRAYGLPGLGGNLRDIYTRANQTLYADIPELFQTSGLPDHHHFIGPIIWSPQAPIPHWWGSVPEGRPIVYVTLGSSGDAALLPQIMSVLAELDVTGMVSTAGADFPDNPHDNIFIADFLPGDTVASLSSLVICNGGSPTTHQALASGKPVIGIAGNLDQYLNMQAMEAAGTGILLRSGALRSDALRAAVLRLLDGDEYTLAAAAMASAFRRHPCDARFAEILNGVIEAGGGSSSPQPGNSDPSA